MSFLFPLPCPLAFGMQQPGHTKKASYGDSRGFLSIASFCTVTSKRVSRKIGEEQKRKRFVFSFFFKEWTINYRSRNGAQREVRNCAAEAHLRCLRKFRKRQSHSESRPACCCRVSFLSFVRRKDVGFFHSSFFHQTTKENKTYCGFVSFRKKNA